MQIITDLGTYQYPLSTIRYDLLSDGAEAPTSISLPYNAELYIYLTSDLYLHFPDDDTLVDYIRVRGAFSPLFDYHVSFEEIGESNTGISLAGDGENGYTISYTGSADARQPGLWRGQLKITVTPPLVAIPVKTYSYSISIIALDKYLVEEGKLHVAEPVDIGNEAIFMSDPDNRTQYLLFASTADFNCVQSYSIFTGSEQPFEYVKLKISKKQLSVAAPDLMDRIISGKNIVTLIGPGQGQYKVTTCKKSNTEWTVTAYSISELIRGITTSGTINISELGTPYDVLVDLAMNAFSSISSGSLLPPPVQGVAALFHRDRNVWEIETAPEGQESNTLIFAKGTSVWYIMSVCALKLGCKLWVANGTLYIIDTTITGSDIQSDNTIMITPVGLKITDIDTIYLNRNGEFPYSLTQTQEALLSNIVDLPTLGKEGQNVLRNVVTVEFDSRNDYRTADPDGVIIEHEGTDPSEVGTKKGAVVSDSNEDILSQSIRYFTEISHTIKIPEFGYANAKAVATQTAKMFCDAETSISFRVRELIEETEDAGGVPVTTRTWRPTFDQLTHVHNIYDYTDDVIVSSTLNFNHGQRLASKAMLSLIEYSFPEHITTYTFGMSTPTDVTQNTSIIQNTLYNG